MLLKIKTGKNCYTFINTDKIIMVKHNFYTEYLYENKWIDLDEVPENVNLADLRHRDRCFIRIYLIDGKEEVFTDEIAAEIYHALSNMDDTVIINDHSWNSDEVLP